LLSKDGSYLVHVVHETKGITQVLIRVYIWDVTTKKPVTPPFELVFNGRIDNKPLAGAFHPKSSEFALMGTYPKAPGQTGVWLVVMDAATGRLLRSQEFPIMSKEPTGFGYMPAGDKLFVSFKKECYAVDMSKKPVTAEGEICKTLPETNRGFLPFPPDNVLAWDKIVKVWSLNQHAAVDKFANSEDVLWPNLAISPDGRRAVAFTLAANNKLGVSAWDIESGKRTMALTGLGGFDETTNPYELKVLRPSAVAGFRDVAITPDGDRVAYRHNRTLRIIRVPELK
jgi:hypothetical protein